jgi:tRNA A-37 threonylcarbamoyl transferase component Bud32
VTVPAGCVDGVLAGRYRFDERIAVGGMGEVWRAEDTVLGRVVAVKCLKPEYVDDADFRERFRAEARHAAGLSHPGIASVFDYGEQVEPDRSAWLVMELVDGESLAAVLHRVGRMPPQQALDVVGQAALGLEAAHEAGVVHRDVKPGNLLVRPDGVVKITDFGIAWAADAVPLTRTGTVVGTAYYLSPEQASGAPVTPASDVYSLGVVAYECLAGARPFPGTNPIAVANAHLQQSPPPLPDDVPAPVRDLVMSALEKDPGRRPAHAGDFGRAALALRDALIDEADPTTSVSVHPPAAARPEDAADGGHGAAPTRAFTTLSAAAAPPPLAAAVGAGAPGSSPGLSAGLPTRPERPVRPAARPHDHRRSVRLTSLLLGVVVVGLLLRSCLASAAVVVPTVTSGLSVDAATSRLTAAGLDPVRTTQSSKTVPAGRVIGTDPAAGTRLHEGDQVTLVVSSGRPRVSVSSATYQGQSPEAVRTALVALGLQPRFAYDGSASPAGTVSSVSPTGSLTYGAAVTIHVVPTPSQGHGGGKHGKGGGGD